MKRYRLRAKHQRRPAAKDGLNRLPFSGLIFVGASVVETELDLSMWSGFLEEVAPEVALEIEEESQCLADSGESDGDDTEGDADADAEADSEDEDDAEPDGDEAGDEPGSTPLIPSRPRRRARASKERGI